MVAPSSGAIVGESCAKHLKLRRTHFSPPLIGSSNRQLLAELQRGSRLSWTCIARRCLTAMELCPKLGPLGKNRWLWNLPACSVCAGLSYPSRQGWPELSREYPNQDGAARIRFHLRGLAATLLLPSVSSTAQRC